MDSLDNQEKKIESDLQKIHLEDGCVAVKIPGAIVLAKPGSSKCVIVYFDGPIQYFQDGNFHRTDGPAIEWSDGSKHWLQSGKYHRLDGPAIECSDGIREWWIDGENLSKEDFQMIQKQSQQEEKRK